MAAKLKKSNADQLQENTKLISVFRNMIVTRLLDQKMLIMLKQGKSYFHIASSGHEAVQTAFAHALKPGSDWAFPYYRDLGFVVEYGLSANEVFLNFLARESDPSSGGRQMSNHYGHRPLRIVTQSSPTGTQFLQAVGCALSTVRQGGTEVVYVSSGEGTTAQGDFHEAVNWAARDQLPVIFVIQNNKYAISVPVKRQLAGSSIYKIGQGYEGLNCFKVDGTDFFKSLDIAQQAVKLARGGKGPALIEADTIRLQPHSNSDSDLKYRSRSELERDRKNDPLLKFETYLVGKNILSAEAVDALKKTVKKEIDLAAEEAEAAAEPSADSVTRFVFSENQEIPTGNPAPPPDGANKVVLVDTINHTLKEEMAANDKMYIFGQDVADGKGGVFSATTGISSEFGEQRCFNAPLAESSIVGVAIGMAVTGLKPVIEIQFADYVWTAMMQIRNELSTIRWRSNNHWSSPVVIRMPVGGYIHGALCHSQNIEAFFSHIPGLKIVYPSQADDAKGLLKSAIRGDDPVLFLEHKGLYRQSFAAAAEPDKDYLLPIGKGVIRETGTDATVVTYGALVQKSREAARQLAKEGYRIEIIDIRSIVPLDMPLIMDSVKKTNRVLVAHEDSLFQGFGAEIAAQISEFAFQYLDAPVLRLGGKDTPIGFNAVLENNTLPQTADILEKLRSLLAY